MRRHRPDWRGLTLNGVPLGTRPKDAAAALAADAALAARVRAAILAARARSDAA